MNGICSKILNAKMFIYFICNMTIMSFFRFQKDGVILDSEDDFLFDSGFEEDGGEPIQDELHNIANNIGSVLDLWELGKELRMKDDIIAKALPAVVHTSLAHQILKSWSREKAGNEKAKKKILKTIPEYERIRSWKSTLPIYTVF